MKRLNNTEKKKKKNSTSTSNASLPSFVVEF